VDPPHESLAFDRAVDYYDRTRRLSDATMRRLVEMLAGELRDRGPCLEIGIGTGRIALPLAHAGVELVGIDLSAPMVRELVRKSGGKPPFGVVVGDALALPFKDASCGSVVVVHVLHLIPRWRRAIDEVWRVVRGGGRIVIEVGGSSRGTRCKLLGPIVERIRTTYAKTIDALEDGLFSFTWEASDEARSRAASQTRQWARRRWGDLDQLYEHEHRIDYRVYELP
jgi:ubiquinone/menaquinone biosynthesis C-methylase UbiE